MPTEINVIVVSLSGGRLLAGAGQGLLTTSVYTVEVVSPQLRGPLSVLEGAARSLGVVLVYSLGAAVSWHTAAALATAAPALALVMVLRSPESPVHLVSRDRMEEAERSLKKLHNYGYDATEDLQIIRESLEKTKADDSQVSMLETLKELNKHPELYKPFLIVSLLRSAEFSQFPNNADWMFPALSSSSAAPRPSAATWSRYSPPCSPPRPRRRASAAAARDPRCPAPPTSLPSPRA